MNCPYCNKPLLNTNLFGECIQSDHEFWIAMDSTDDWYIHHPKTDLFIDKNMLCFNETERQDNPLMEFDNLSPQEGADQLKKIIKLKGFL